MESSILASKIEKTLSVWNELQLIVKKRRKKDYYLENIFFFTSNKTKNWRKRQEIEEVDKKIDTRRYENDRIFIER